MGRKDAEYDPTSFAPPQFVHLMLAVGGSKPFEVFQDLQRNKELVQCDKCGKFLQLPGKRSVSVLDNHRGKPICVNAAARRQRKQAEVDESIRANAALRATLWGGPSSARSAATSGA